MPGGWITVEAKENRKPKGPKQTAKKRRDSDSDDDAATAFQWAASRNSAAAPKYPWQVAADGADSNNTFGIIQQVAQRQEKERVEKKEQMRIAKEEAAKRKAAERAALERRRAAVERARREADPTTWPTLGESLVERSAEILDALRDVVNDPLTRSKPTLRLQYIVGTLSQKTPRTVEWPVGDDEAFPGCVFSLPLGPALEDRAAVDVVAKILSATATADVTGAAVVNTLLAYFNAKGSKKAEVGEGVATRALLQLLLRHFAPLVLGEFDALKALFVDSATGKFHSKVAFTNFCWVMYQLVVPFEAVERFCRQPTATVARAAATHFFNALMTTDWYHGDAATYSAALTFVSEAFAALQELESGEGDAAASTGASTLAVRLETQAAVEALTQAAANGGVKSAVYKLLVGHALAHRDTPATVFTGVLDAIPEHATSETHGVFLSFLAELLATHPRLFTKWISRVAEAPAGSALLIESLVSAKRPLDVDFVAQATLRLTQVSSRKKIEPELAAKCTAGLKALAKASAKPLVAAALAAAAQQSVQRASSSGKGQHHSRDAVPAASRGTALSHSEATHHGSGETPLFVRLVGLAVILAGVYVAFIAPKLK